MANQPEKEWHQFEELIADLHKGFHPGATITRHEKLLGQNSGTKREIDVCIRQRVGIQDLLIIIDCKKRSRKVDVIGMDSFIGLKNDVAAHTGVIVSEKGFSKSAIRLAARSGVQALTFMDTKRQDWAKDLLIPVGLDLRVMMPTRITFEANGKAEIDVAPNDLHLHDKQTRGDITLKQLLERNWFDKSEPAPGSWTTVFDAYENDGKPSGTLRFSFSVENRKYISRVGLDFIGLVDGQRNVAHMKSVQFPEIPLSDIERNWKRLGADEPFPSAVLVMVLKTVLHARLEDSKIVPAFPNVALTLSLETKPETPLALAVKS
jgi:hypothetical protein